MTTSSILLGPIVGGLSHNRANIWARANSPSILHVWLATHADLNDAQLVGEVELPARDGCTGILPIDHLKPETKYYYAVSLHPTRPALQEFHTFVTFPQPRILRSFSFAFGSCYLPPDDQGGQTMHELRHHIESDDLRFGLFLGDQIYADSTERNGLRRIAVTLEEYRTVYEYGWSRPAMRELLPNLPLFMTLDDHEVDDDWFWRDPERRWAEIPVHNQFFRWLKGLPPEQRHLSLERVRAALKAYYEHQAMHGPEMLLPLETNAAGDFQFHRHDAGSLAYRFYFGGAAFFVLDTRTMRVKGRKKSLLSEGQWTILQEWLKQVNEQYPVKFLFSSGTILHPFWLDITRDRWNGFPAERERLLKFLAVNEIEGVHIITGDLHTAHAIFAELKCPSGRRIAIWEFCSSPFEQSASPSTITYHPLISKWIGSQKRLFWQTGQNFGVVHVDFDSSTPHVIFTLHYNQNGWKTRRPITNILNI
jgi:phosphodiesterase/alkaline phosphatase D-like protein